MRWRLHESVRRLNHGTVLVGGSPITVMRLSASGRRAIDRALSGTAPTTDPEHALVDRLIDAGLLLVEPTPSDSRPTADEVTVVIPVRDDGEALAAALTAVGELWTRPARVIVVDDASIDGAAVVEIAGPHGAEVVRLDHNVGPAAARTAGLDGVTTPFVAVVDADVVVSPGWLDASLAFFSDQRVAVVAPRVEPIGLGDDALSSYERARSALDLGPNAGVVRRRSRIAYVPSAALVMRRAALVEVGGFDAGLRVGEDVDLVWRLADADHRVWYCGDVVTVGHRHRSSLLGWARRRYDYGTSAALLEDRHPGAVRPLGISKWSAAVWAAVAVGQPIVAMGIAAATTAQLATRLDFLDQPIAVAFSLAGRGDLHAGESLARAFIRPWWPLAQLASLGSRRARRVAIAAAVVPPLLEWRRQRPALDPVRWTILCLADDVAYSAGVWVGCLRTGRFAAIAPIFG